MFTDHIGAYVFACTTVCFAYSYSEPLLEQNIFEGIQLASLMDELKWVISIETPFDAQLTKLIPLGTCDSKYTGSQTPYLSMSKKLVSIRFPIMHMFLSAE